MYRVVRVLFQGQVQWGSLSRIDVLFERKLDLFCNTNGQSADLQDAPPVKRNVPRPSVHPYDLMPSSSSSSLSGRPGGLAASGSVSGMNLYIPPYVQSGRISPAPGPPPGSGGFADLGLPPGHRHSLAVCPLDIC
jgi:hypothetical protein